jgi:Co/Zn/Cd efflux system component
MNIVLAIAALAVSAFLAFGFWKAGSFKAKASKETLLGAGFGWVEKISMGTVRLIAWLELLGAVGVVLAPIGYYATGFVWSQWVGVAAAAGLALTMVVAFIMHAARGEAKYTWKMNIQLLLVAAVAAVLQALVQYPLF